MPGIIELPVAPFEKNSAEKASRTLSGNKENCLFEKKFK